MQRCFSPPEITFDFFKASSPEKSIRPKNPRIKLSSFSTEYCRSQSTKFIEASSKKEALSFGKYVCVVVTPHLNSPDFGFALPDNISNKAVMANESFAKKATLSPLLIVKERFVNKGVPSSVVADNFSTLNNWSPASRSGLKLINGYLREDGFMSST